MSDHLCNLVIPGAAKSGTSSLHELLNLHPQICMSNKKEPHYFCRPDVHARGADFHNSLFSKTRQKRIFGESSTGYLIWPEAISHVRHDLADPKIIIVLREPVARAFSHYRWRVRLGLETRSFLRAMQEDGYGYDPMHRDNGYGYTAYLQFSNYAEYCPLWEEAFGAKNVLMLDSDMLRTDHIGVQTRCFEFLEVDNLPARKRVEANRTEEVVSRGRVIRKGLRFVPDILRRSAAFKALRNAAQRRVTLTPPATMSDEEAAYASDRLARDVAWFRDRFG